MAGDVLASARELGLSEPFRIMGHSLGGRVALAAALREPETLQKITLLDISPSPSRCPGSDSTLIVRLIASGRRRRLARALREHCAPAACRPRSSSGRC